MKTILLSMIICAQAFCLSAADTGVHPLLPAKFGEVMSLEVEFIDKGGDYYDQNIVKAPWSAKVLAVNGRKLEQPVVIEYRSSSTSFTKGTTYQLQGYEDIYSFGNPKGWNPSLNQFDYAIIHRLILKPPVGPKSKKDA